MQELVALSSTGEAWLALLWISYLPASLLTWAMEWVLSASSALPKSGLVGGLEFCHTAFDPQPWQVAAVGLFRRAKPKLPASRLVQENPGFYLSISTDLDATGHHAAKMTAERYQRWLKSDWSRVDSQFKCQHFTIAVGGGNTVKAHYQALLEQQAHSIDWLERVRFFFLEESTPLPGWESSRDALVNAFIQPLAGRLLDHHGSAAVTARLGLQRRASGEAIVQSMLDKMVYGFDMSAINQALSGGESVRAKKLAHDEAARYQEVLHRCLGKSLAFHMIISGVGKDGGIGAFVPYAAELQKKQPRVLVVKKVSGPLQITLNRGILTAAECVSLIISGSLKLKALGRFEMEDSADFEQTVMETPIRMLRENRKIAEKVLIFADDQALHFDEGLVQFQEQGKTVKVRSEVRDGEEANGIHMLLAHGFMGLYSFINLLIRLPSDWKVSALHRGSYARRLPDPEIFPHYAHCLRHCILQNWRDRRPTPVGCHSIAGIISDHLLLSILDGYRQTLPEYDELGPEDQALIQALRAGGIIHLASWAPSDVVHIASTIENLKAHRRRGEALDYSGPAGIYRKTRSGALELNDVHYSSLDQRPPLMAMLGKLPGTRASINVMTRAARRILKSQRLQQRLSNRETPYALRVIGGRLLKHISFYGLLKEVNAALHSPYEYQRRHLLALDALVKYDIPYLCIVHKDDFMVSANRHAEEHRYLLKARMKREGARRQQDLITPVRLLLLERTEAELPADPLNPHLLLMSTSMEGDSISRQVIAAMSNFVHENAARASADGAIEPLASVARWQAGEGAHAAYKRSQGRKV